MIIWINFVDLTVCLLFVAVFLFVLIDGVLGMIVCMRVVNSVAWIFVFVMIVKFCFAYLMVHDLFRCVVLFV